MKKAFSAVGLAVVALASMTATPAVADVPPVGPTPIVGSPQVVTMAPSVALQCAGPGASDVVSRKHSIKNTAGHAIPKGTVVHWNASNKGTGSVTLSADLAPNATIDVIEPGQTNGYTCNAWFFPGGPDYAIKTVAWNAAGTQATVVVEDLNPWTDAKASTVRVSSMRCLSTLVASVEAPVPAIPKGGSVAITVNMPKAGADYLQAVANVGGLPETNKANNVGRSFEFGTNKSCTPQ